MKKGVDWYILRVLLLVSISLLLVNISYSGPPDADGDGVPDTDDLCPGSTTTVVDQFGCSCAQKTQTTPTTCASAYPQATCCTVDTNECTSECRAGWGQLPRCVPSFNNILPCDAGTGPGTGLCLRGSCKSFADILPAIKSITISGGVVTITLSAPINGVDSITITPSTGELCSYLGTTQVTCNTFPVIFVNGVLTVTFPQGTVLQINIPKGEICFDDEGNGITPDECKKVTITLTQGTTITIGNPIITTITSTPSPLPVGSYWTIDVIGLNFGSAPGALDMLDTNGKIGPHFTKSEPNYWDLIWSNNKITLKIYPIITSTFSSPVTNFPIDLRVNSTEVDPINGKISNPATFLVSTIAPMTTSFATGFGPVEHDATNAQTACVTPVANVLTKSFTIHLTPQHSGCTSSNPVSDSCNAAIHRYCQSIGYVTGFGPFNVVGDIANIACLNTVTLVDATFTDLNAEHSECTSSNPVSDSCNAAINRYCNNRGYGITGFGPVEHNANALVACVNSDTATIFQPLYTELTQKDSGCPADGYVSESCNTAIHLFCKGQTTTTINPPTVDLKINEGDGPLTVTSGSTLDVSWSSTNADSCDILVDGNPLYTNQPTSGSFTTEAVSSSGTITLKCTGSGGTASDSIYVTVIQCDNDGVVDTGELCDCGGSTTCTSAQLGDEICESLGYDLGGTLSCTSNCQFDTSGCATSNNPPTLDPIGDKSVNEGSPLGFTISGSDPDVGDTLTFSASNLPSGATFDISTKTFSWTPTSTQSGTYNPIFTVSDGRGGTDSETITITVNDVTSVEPLLTITDLGGSTIIEEGEDVNLTVTNGATKKDIYLTVAFYGGECDGAYLLEPGYFVVGATDNNGYFSVINPTVELEYQGVTYTYELLIDTWPTDSYTADVTVDSVNSNDVLFKVFSSTPACGTTNLNKFINPVTCSAHFDADSDVQVDISNAGAGKPPIYLTIYHYNTKEVKISNLNIGDIGEDGNFVSTMPMPTISQSTAQEIYYAYVTIDGFKSNELGFVYFTDRNAEDTSFC